ncbi:MAG: caspase family protein, partial [Muribaculaceae bacterium]|nr:caspase family protein [Muribaculaceae bacterium]
ANTLRAVSALSTRVDALGGNADVIVYYAGHGMPDERTRDAYILPVDGDATVSETCYPLSRLYAELGDLNAKSVAVFIDACFSGAQRQQDGDMLTQARAVVIKPKETAPKGNMLVLSAASGNETALPYAEKNHGLFTYYLLKKLKDTKGNTTLKELSDYVIENVKRQSNFINSKPQTPTATTSGAMSELWRTKKFRP